MPILDRGIEACARGTVINEDGNEYRAVASILYWLEHGEQAGRIATDFPRFNDLAAVCVVETLKRYLRMRNQVIVDQAVADGFMGVAV